MTQLFNAVQKPHQYTGGEYGLPDFNKKCDVRFCICVPDSYEVGMSNLGIRILYYLLNQQDGVVCERCFAPWEDYVEYLNSREEKLCSLETRTSLAQFDFVGFSLQYEMCYSNVFYMLNLAGIPLTCEERGENFPLIAAGGPCAVNMEPMYKYFDMIFVGEGESPWPRILEDYKKMKGVRKSEFLRYVSENYSCIYVPSLWNIEYEGDVVKSMPDRKVVRNIEKDLNTVFTPDKQWVPGLEIVHDRAVLELFRGCANGCRFCQAGIIYRPVRERSAEKSFELCKKLLEFTGYNELSLNSLSTGDYSGLDCLLKQLLPYAQQNNVKLNLPSLRLDTFRGGFSVGNRKSSLTFAPEAGTQRLRDVINKNITEDNIMSTLEEAFREGYSSVKLYFMIGLPTETAEDIEGIYNIARQVKSLYSRTKMSKKPLRISVSCSTFIPKPFTPFQWEAFDSRENVSDKLDYLREKFRSQGIAFAYNDYDCSLMEAVLARGGRSIADAMAEAFRKGARFDAWSEYFKGQLYFDAFDKLGIDISKIVGAKDVDELLPWDFVDVGVDKSFLVRERNKAYLQQTTPSCTVQCNACGLHKMGFCKSTHGNAGWQK